jgi:ATP synthase protein I
MSIFHSVFNNVWIKLYFHAVKNNAVGTGFMDENKGKLRDFARLTRLSSIGIAFILCSFIGFGVGYYIDTLIHTKPIFMIVFIIVGTGAGFLNAYRTITKDTD